MFFLPESKNTPTFMFRSDPFGLLKAEEGLLARLHFLHTAFLPPIGKRKLFSGSGWQCGYQESEKVSSFLPTLLTHCVGTRCPLEMGYNLVPRALGTCPAADHMRSLGFFTH